ncbi:MAG: S46 family peptidase [Bryobacterales bacterium]|nr:S46 family peptidase [Bryobacterales bacterium]
MLRLPLAVLLVAAFFSVAAEEGKWTPSQVLELDAGELRQMGLQIAPRDLWDPAKGSGLLSAAINISGCSASFVSTTGLIATNHHCLFGVLQEHSTRERDIISNGFLARERGQELPGRTTRVTVPRAFADVTAQMEAAAANATDDLSRYHALDRKQKELVAACEAKPNRRCRLARFDGGVQYILQEMMELRDVRLVYAPPRAIGEYGGEVDNWMWPRHTGDFSIARAYVSPSGEPADYNTANVPYAPERFLRISQRPLREGDFVMVLGYPGLTYRSLLAEEMRERRDLFFARRVELFGEWIELLEAVSKDSEEGRIAVAADLKSLLNRYKNAQGQMDGFRRGDLLNKQLLAEREVLAWAASRAEWQPAVAARAELLRHFEERLTTWERDFLFANIGAGPKSLSFAQTLVRLATERTKPDMERDEAYMERNLRSLLATLERQQKSYFPEADKQMLLALVERARKLPSGQRIEAIDALFPTSLSRQELASRIDALYRNSKVLELESRKAMAGESTEALRARKDPFLDLAFSMEERMAGYREAERRWEGTISRLRPAWRKAVMAHAGKPVAPDANSTLRVSFAHVAGYAPRDAVAYGPFTTLSGVVEKNTGKDPFAVPSRVLDAAKAGKGSRWKDAALNDIAVNFLATGDTTGGNSGSPMVNGYGELVGLNFDRVWENVANDFGYNPAIARNVSVDIRYMLWTLEAIDGAGELLAELGITR